MCQLALAANNSNNNNITVATTKKLLKIKFKQQQRTVCALQMDECLRERFSVSGKLRVWIPKAKIYPVKHMNIFYISIPAITQACNCNLWQTLSKNRAILWDTVTAKRNACTDEKVNASWAIFQLMLCCCCCCCCCFPLLPFLFLFASCLVRPPTALLLKAGNSVWFLFRLSAKNFTGNHNKDTATQQ